MHGPYSCACANALLLSVAESVHFCTRLCACLFTATKNADQLLAVWRMIEKFAFSAEESGVAPQLAYRTLVYVSAVLSTAVMWLRVGSTA